MLGHLIVSSISLKIKKLRFKNIYKKVSETHTYTASIIPENYKMITDAISALPSSIVDFLTPKQQALCAHVRACIQRKTEAT
jgi:hypothetical protein